MAINPERSLASLYPHVAAEWHPSKNGDVTPDNVAAQSNKKRWWLCAGGHEWEAVVQNRTVRSRGCKACSLLRDGSLASKFPLVAEQWHPTRNGDVTPDLVPPKSARKFYWLCPSDSSHEWFVGVDKRTSYGAGCQVCGAGQVDVSDVEKRSYRRHGLLMDEYPDLAKQWHPTKNERKLESISSGSAVDAFWKCESGHEWKARVSSRTLDGRGCPECAKLSRGSLAEANPTLASEWHPTLNGDLTPALVNISHKDKVWWLGKECGHEWDASVVGRVFQKWGCPYCAGSRVLTGFNDLATLRPDIAAEWHHQKNINVSVDQVNISYNNKVRWVCVEGHEWDATVSGRVFRHTNCPVCSGQRAEPGFNDLATLRPDVAAEGIKSQEDSVDAPTKVTLGSNRKIWWQCPVNATHTWLCTVADRTRRDGLHTGCPHCAAGIRVSRGERSVIEVVKSLSGLEEFEISTSNLSVISRELDIYIPERKLAIEFNGLYWHSEAAGKDYSYHASKSQACAEKGIHLIHVWEDDWRDRRDIVVRALAHRLKATERLNEPGVLLVPDESFIRRYGARTLVPHVISATESVAFLEANHIQGKGSGTLHVGLRDKEGILRAVFVAKRVGNKGHEGEWRIERYATRGIVPGGFTKLMKFAEQHIHHSNLGDLTKWVTFSDGALSDGGLYRNYGFVEDGLVRPDYQYVVKGQRVHKFNYRLKRFRDDPTLQYEEGMSERELALLNNIPRIWDSGKTRWIKKVSR